MTHEEKKAIALFNKDQVIHFKQACDAITSTYPTQLAKDAAKRLYYNSLFAAYQKGRCDGVDEARALVDKYNPLKSTGASQT